MVVVVSVNSGNVRKRKGKLALFDMVASLLLLFFREGGGLVGGGGDCC